MNSNSRCYSLNYRYSDTTSWCSEPNNCCCNSCNNCNCSNCTPNTCNCSTCCSTSSMNSCNCCNCCNCNCCNSCNCNSSNTFNNTCCNTCNCLNNCCNNCCTGFNCGQTTSTTIIPTTITTPIPITSVATNTLNLCNPSVKIDFTSTINFTAILVGATLTLATPFTVILQLSKVSNQGSKISLGSFSYSYSSPLSTSINSSVPFNFNYIDCNTCPNCYTYIVEIISVTPLSLSVGAITSQTASINTASLCATIASC